MNWLQRILNLIFLPLIIFGAVHLVKKWIADKPPREVRRPPEVIAPAEFVERSLTTEVPTVKTYGNTRSYFDTALSAQVAGEIKMVSANFNAGNRVGKGEVLVELDSADYLTAIAEAEAAVVQAKQTFAEEQTLGAIAEEDWVDSGRDLANASDFTLRKPQMAAAQSTVASAEASVQQARLNLERTKVRAPFDAIVTARSASPGNVASVGTSLGSLISRDLAEVRLPLTPEQVSLLNLPSSNSEAATAPQIMAVVRSSSQPNQQWEARLARTEPGVDAQNQVLFVVAEIKRPFETEESFLPIGAFVNVEIPGRAIEDCYHIPATALIEDSYLWIIDDSDHLLKRSAQRLYSSESYTLVSLGEMAEEGPLRIVTRPLASFSEGQKVKPLSASKEEALLVPDAGQPTPQP